jgi:hypothetical protein
LAHTAIKQEQANPSQATLEDVEKSLWRIKRNMRVMPLIGALTDAAAAQLATSETHGINEGFLDKLSEHYPKHRNVVEVVGENQAQVYVVNHSHLVGLNRNRKASLLTEEGVDAQFYHESRGAAFADMFRVYGQGIAAEKMGRRAMDYRLGALALRSSASQTVLTSLRPTEVYELVHSSSGLHIRPVPN